MARCPTEDHRLRADMTVLCLELAHPFQVLVLLLEGMGELWHDESGRDGWEGAVEEGAGCHRGHMTTTSTLPVDTSVAHVCPHWHKRSQHHFAVQTLAWSL